MPDPITAGHVLMAAAALAALAALAQLVGWLRHRGFERGTPQYARARTARRSVLYALAVAAVLFAAGCFTPLADMALTGGGA